jgi:hypothetical protein
VGGGVVVVSVLLKISVWLSATALVVPCADLRLAGRMLYLVWLLATALAVRRADLPAAVRVLSRAGRLYESADAARPGRRCPATPSPFQPPQRARDSTRLSAARSCHLLLATALQLYLNRGVSSAGGFAEGRQGRADRAAAAAPCPAPPPPSAVLAVVCPNPPRAPTADVKKKAPAATQMPKSGSMCTLLAAYALWAL